MAWLSFVSLQVLCHLETSQHIPGNRHLIATPHTIKRYR
jgi:hypothetical protein